MDHTALTIYKDVPWDYWKYGIQHFGSLEAFKKYENAVFIQLDAMKSGDVFDIVKKVSKKNYKIFIALASDFIVCCTKAGINYYFNESYNQIKKI